MITYIDDSDVKNNLPVKECVDELRGMIDKNIDSVKNSEIIYISCTAMTTSKILDKLSMIYRKQVISENSAILWKISRITGKPVKIPGLQYI